MIAIILVGGFGTRLRPLTINQPKGLLPVLNRPFLSYQIDMMQKAGVSDVIFAAGIHNKQWELAFRKLKRPGLHLHFAYEPKPLGTGGAIRHAFDHCSHVFKNNHEPVLIVNGDIFMELDVKEFIRNHNKKNADVSVALIKVLDPSRFGLVITGGNDRIQRFVEKPKFKLKINRVNAGAYLFNQKIFSSIPRKRAVSVEKDTFPGLLKSKKTLCGHSIAGYWNDIGTPSTYLQAHLDLAGKNRDWTDIKYLRKRSGLPKVFQDNSAKLAPHVKLTGMVSLGSQVIIAKDVVLEDCIVMDRAHVSESCVIKKAIIGRGCRIGHHSVINPGIVLGENSIITPYTKL